MKCYWGRAEALLAVESGQSRSRLQTSKVTRGQQQPAPGNDRKPKPKPKPASKTWLHKAAKDGFVLQPWSVEFFCAYFLNRISSHNGPVPMPILSRHYFLDRYVSLWFFTFLVPLRVSLNPTDWRVGQEFPIPL